MRNLPTKISEQKEIIIRAVMDFFNRDRTDRDVINTAVALMNRKVELTDEQKEAVWYVRENLTDKRYRRNLMGVL